MTGDGLTGDGLFGTQSLYNRLARELAELPESRAWRDRVIRTVEEHLGATLAVARNDVPLRDLQAIVEICGLYPGGLHALLDAVAEDYAGSLPLARAQILLDQYLPAPLLRAAERRELCGLLTAEVRAAAESLPPSGSEPPGRPAAKCTGLEPLLQCALELLGRIPATGPADPVEVRVASLVALLEDDVEVEGRPHALMAFVEQVAAAAMPRSPRRTELLRDWNDRVTARLGWDPELLERVRAEESERAGLPVVETVLVVEITSRRSAAELFTVRARLMDHRYQLTPVLWDERARGRGQLEAGVDRVHTRAVTRLADLASGLRVEFILPRHLIWLDVDRFPVSPMGMGARPIGEEHIVHVRPLDRIALTHVSAHHQRRWRWLQTHGGEYQESAVAFVEPGEGPDPGRLRRELRFQRPETPVLYILFEPPGHTEDRAEDYLTVLFEAGVPVVIGVRTGGETHAARQEIRNLLKTAPKELPERVRLLRGGVRPAANGAIMTADPDSTSDADVEVDISLVWDSPEGLKELRSVLLQPPIRGEDDRPA
ncbi:hypothetical protein [Streptomyces sp. NPDC058045]|uniref:VMAP-C domain-containing protein n=1 Tax=Streptomyces sp. NPDC058045 TaxID=3346311 RepID=UPI0036EE1A52